MPAPERELTVKAVGLGLFLAFVFGAANAYLGMRAGQTVAATIPAAVIALAIFKLPMFRGGLLEQNITRTSASVGEALVAGAIFTLPAFMMIEVDGQRLWTDLRDHYVESAAILLAGGLIGVLFIVLLRRPLCVEADLPWPESVASVEIVRAGQQSTSAPKYIFGAMAFGGFIQLLKSDKGFGILREYVEGFLRFPASSLRHFDFDRKTIAQVGHAGGIPWSTPALSPALIGIGYIIGPKLASINVAGGVIAWWLLIPALLFFDPDLGARLGGATPDVQAYSVWFNVVRPIAVGTMLVAACNTLFGLRHSIAQSLTGAFRMSTSRESQDPTERDIPLKWTVILIGLTTLAVFGIYVKFTGSVGAAAVAALVMCATGFLLSAVGGYLVGLVGSSNQPLSGLTLATLVISALMMLAIGMRGASGMIAVLGVAAVVACACSVSGSLVQDLKAGHLLGGTPWKMELVEIITVVLLSFFLLVPIVVLHEANLETGGIGGRALPAPQAGLMAQLTTGIVGGQMAWGLLIIGAAFGIALLLCGARAPMLVAVGMYLPFDTSSAIFLGGALKWVVERSMQRRTPEDAARVEERGTLLASGLIAGEAILGIALAAVFLAGVPSIYHVFTGVDQPALTDMARNVLSVLGFASIAYVLIAIPRRHSRR